MTRLAVYILLTLSVIFIASCLAHADETYICRFEGIVQLNGKPVPDGTVITAIVVDDEYTTVTQTSDGRSRYSLIIPTQTGDNYPSGTIVYFRVYDLHAHQTVPLIYGKNIKLDLSASGTLISTSVPTPVPLTPSGSNSGLVIGLIFACIAEGSVVAGVTYIFFTEWEK